MKYWPEFLSLLLFCIVSVVGINQYHQIQLLDYNHKIKAELKKSIIEFSLESISMVSPSVYHFDKQAEHRLHIDHLLIKLEAVDYELTKKVKTYGEEATEYIRLSTMLKTSNKLIASLQEQLNHLEVSTHLKHKINELIVLVHQLAYKPTYNISAQIELFTNENEIILRELALFDIQWKMIKLHINFILENTNKVDVNNEKLKASALVENITQSEVSTIESLTYKRHLFFICILLAIVCLFVNFIIALSRQASQLKIKTAEAKQASEVKSQFLANMSHEIRTPMNGILGLSDIVLNSELTSVQRDFMDKLKFSARSLMTIINDILDFSKIESQKLSIEIIDFNLDELLDHLKIMIGYKASDKGLELVFKIEDGISNSYIGDPIRINQILLNLISNAIKFTEKGYVMVYVKKETKVKNSKVVKGISFSVEDSGIGLTDEQQSQLFQRFHQAELSTTRKYGGTGLGLAISKLLSELMEGDVSVESEEGKGSCFTLFLPLVSPAIVPSSILDTSLLEDRSILVVEDDLNTREVTVSILEKYKMNVGSACDFASAVNNVKLKTYDIILTDWCLPDHNGSKFIDYLCDTGYSKHNIIIFTGFNNEHLDIAHDYIILRKPLIIKDLVKVLNAAFLKGDDNNLASRIAELSPKKVDSPSNKAKKDPKSHDTSCINILFAEDNRINATIVKNVLSNINSNVIHVENGQLALDEMEKHTFDIILMDVQMPVMGGMEATRIIRTELKSDIPIIAFTANILPNEIAEYKAAGVTDHIGKPFEKEDLLTLVNKYVT